MLDFQVEVASAGACSVVNVVGELDIATSPRLVEALEEAEATPSTQIVVNLLRTSFIDSTGLTTLFRAHKSFGEQARAFCLVCGPGNIEVLRVMDLMGFDEVFTVHDSMASAGCEDVVRLHS